jgi:hypothetical protein
VLELNISRSSLACSMFPSGFWSCPFLFQQPPITGPFFPRSWRPSNNLVGTDRRSLLGPYLDIVAPTTCTSVQYQGLGTRTDTCGWIHRKRCLEYHNIPGFFPIMAAFAGGRLHPTARIWRGYPDAGVPIAGQTASAKLHWRLRP